MTVSIVDYGRGNLFSICRALDALNIESKVIVTPEEILAADRLILPGVGAFADAMSTLIANSFDQALEEYASTGRPMLGICLGMQLMLDQSFEHDRTNGLGFIAGDVIQLSPLAANGELHKIPNVGWLKTSCNADHSPSKSVLALMDSHEFYFVHSFVGRPHNDENILSTASYNGIEFCAAIVKDNLVGVQFHPERSGKIGLELLAALLSKDGN